MTTMLRIERKGRKSDAATEGTEDDPTFERKSLTLEIKDEAKGEVEAVFSTFGVIDHDGDWTDPKAFEDGTEVLIGDWSHGTLFGEPPVGKGVIKVTDKDARLVGKYFLDTIEGREQFATVKNVGPKQQWSYGYNVKETGELTEELRQRGVRRVIKKSEVLEISPVLRGAGIRTRTVLAKDKGTEPPPEPTAEELAAKKLADEAVEKAATEKAAAEAAAAAEKAAQEKAAADQAAAQLKASTEAAVEEFNRIQRTHKRLGLTA